MKHNEDGRPKTALVRLINYDDPLQNQFKVCNQWTVVEHEKIRCDLVVFVNGLPLVVVELKSPSREETDEEDAYLQIKQYQQKCPTLFVYNAFSVTSDLLTSKAGTITSKANRYMDWKSTDGVNVTSEAIHYDTFFQGIFEKRRLIDWNHKETARARMRIMVKRLLKKYHYPPEGQEQALQTVMAQCNKWADDEDNFISVYSFNDEEPEYLQAAEE